MIDLCCRLHRSLRSFHDLIARKDSNRSEKLKISLQNYEFSKKIFWEKMGDSLFTIVVPNPKKPILKSIPPMGYFSILVTFLGGVAVNSIAGIPGIPDIAPQGLSGIYGSRYTHIRLTLTGYRYSEDALPPSITWSIDTE